MTTPTRPKKPIPNEGTLVHIKFSREERQELLGIFGYDTLPLEDQEWFIGAAELNISVYFPQLDRISKRPGPEHIRAELELMLKPAKKLAERLHATTLTRQTKMFVEGNYDSSVLSLEKINIAQLYVTLNDLITNAEQGIKYYYGFPNHDGRYVNRSDKELRKAFKQNLTDFFRIHEGLIPSSEREACLESFLELCFKKLTPPPARRNRKKPIR